METGNTHTAGKWRIGDAGHTIFGPKTDAPSPETIATMEGMNFKANARRIVTAVNCHDELVEACKAALIRITDLEDYLSENGTRIVRSCADQVRKALAAAEGRE